jgi:hypothetical protein
VPQPPPPPPPQAPTGPNKPPRRGVQGGKKRMSKAEKEIEAMLSGYF